MSHTLTLKQKNAVYLLAAGKTTIEVGKALQLRRETLSRWKRIPEFQMELQRIMQEQCDDMKTQLTHLVGESIKVVGGGMVGDDHEVQRLKIAFSLLKMLGIDRMLVSDNIESVIRRNELLAKF